MRVSTQCRVPTHSVYEQVAVIMCYF